MTRSAVEGMSIVICHDRTRADGARTSIRSNMHHSQCDTDLD